MKITANHLIETYYGNGWTIRYIDPKHPGKEGDKAISFDDGICAIITGDEVFEIKTFSAKRATDGMMLLVTSEGKTAWWMDRGIC